MEIKVFEVILDLFPNKNQPKFDLYDAKSTFLGEVRYWQGRNRNKFLKTAEILAQEDKNL